MKVTILISLICILYCSCERKFEVDLPFSADELILYAELPINGRIKAFLSKSSAIDVQIDFELDYTKYTIVLFGDDGVIDTLNYEENGFYYSEKIQFSSTNEYSLKVFNELEGLVLETQSISPLPLLEDVLIKETTKVVQGLNPQYETKAFSIEVADPKSQLDYYSVQITGVSEGIESIVGFFVIGKDSEVRSDCGFALPSSYYFTDKCKLNNSLLWEFGVELATYNAQLQKVVKPEIITITFNNIDKYWYDYYATISAPNFIENAFLVPKVFTSNFKQGRGVWAASNSQIQSFLVK